MLALFRAFAKSWIAKILFVLLIFSFGLIFNVGDMLKSPFSHAIIESKGRDVSAAEFKQLVERQKQQYEQQQGGQPIQMSELLDAHIPQQMASSYAGEVAFGEWMSRAGLKPSKTLITEQLKQFQEFFNPVTGVFDQDRFVQGLQRAGETPEHFKQSLSDQIALHHFGAGFSAGLRLPRIYGAFLATLLLETRDASWFVVDEKVAGPLPAPTDVQLQQFMAAHADHYRRPDMRSATVVLISPALLAKAVKVTDQEIKDEYAKRPDLSTPETRSFVQIATSSQAQAQGIAAAIKAGGDPVAVAKAGKLTAVPYADKAQARLPFPKVAAAVFAMKSGDVAPVQGEAGWSVVKLTSVTPGKVTPLETARAKIDEDLRLEKAKAQVDDLASQYQNLVDKGAKMADAAKTLNLPIYSVALTSAQGVGADGKPSMLGALEPVPADALKSMFGLPKGGTTDGVVQADAGQYFALHVEDIVPSALPALADVREQVTKDWRGQEGRNRLHAKADELNRRVAKGESIAAVAASVGAKLEVSKDFKRPQSPKPQEAQAVIAKNPEILVQIPAFGHPSGQSFVTQAATGFAVARVDGIHTPAPAVAGQLVEQARPQLSQQEIQELYGAARVNAKTRLKTKVHEDRIPGALGIEDPKAKAARQ
jgi:peptidyl-prolyl cis-trans isomerase D